MLIASNFSFDNPKFLTVDGDGLSLVAVVTKLGCAYSAVVVTLRPSASLILLILIDDLLVILPVFL